MGIVSSRSRGWVGLGDNKNEIYAAAFDGYLLYDLFLQGQGRGMPAPGSATE